MRQTHIAGEKVFVDYSGVTVPIHNAKTGEIEKAQVFVAVLGASGYTFVHVTHSQRQEEFILSHVLAYEFFGGTPRVVVPDNLKSAIISNNKNGIVVNESYAALARHYDMMVEPARVRKPKEREACPWGASLWLNKACREYSAGYWHTSVITSSSVSMRQTPISPHFLISTTIR